VDIAAWLRGLGLEQYAPAFRDNDIDGEVLRRLTAEDLRELGVRSIGHRRKLLDAIAALNEVAPAATANPQPFAATAAAPRVEAAERRQLTVMFCDLVGSTELSARLDPEDLREVIGAYHRAVTGVIAQFDGLVSRYMGDGVLVYFGYPQAHEDDAERAVRAGLGAIEAVSRLDTRSVRLLTRVGIATGLVVVGDLIGEGAAQEQSVIGETPNLAARLQALAEPNAVVIASGTRRLVGDLFDYRDLGVVEVKGIAGPVLAWRVLRPSAVESRFEALRGSTLTPLVGRARRSTCCCAAGRAPRPATARSCSFRANPVSANPASPRHWRSDSRPSRIFACAFSARLTIRTARFIRPSTNSAERRGSSLMIRPLRS
jgi:class 3 adenylate cyclase